MSRMHSKRKGQSGSRRPRLSESPAWMPMKGQEIEDMVAKLATDGLRPAMIGLTLRDQHGIPDVKLATGKTITKILKERGTKMEIPDDLASLMRRAVSLSVHTRENPKDNHNRRGLQLIEAKILRLVKYYKNRGILPETWKYSLETAELLVSR